MYLKSTRFLEVRRTFPTTPLVRVGEIVEASRFRNAGNLVRNGYLMPVEQKKTEPSEAKAQNETEAKAATKPTPKTEPKTESKTPAKAATKPTKKTEAVKKTESAKPSAKSKSKAKK